MIQKLKLHQGQTLTKNNIREMLNRARVNYDYFRLELKYGNYITIAFFRDNTFDVMTNNRSAALWADIKFVRNTRGLTALTDMVFKWIREYNR